VRGRFDAWLFRIVANGCKDWLKNIRRTHVSYEEDDQPSHFATPDEDLDRAELRRDLDRALAQLAAPLREAFIMKHVEGRSYEEMADLLGTTVGRSRCACTAHARRSRPCSRRNTPDGRQPEPRERRPGPLGAGSRGPCARHAWRVHGPRDRPRG
jgi:DNA-directed RNA polymerase specialized sigma24 family protein